jgi:tetratricopeptide (TPR) repeat protein
MNNDNRLALRCRFRTLGLIALVLLSQAFQPGHAKDLEDHDWIEVRTPNFRIRSTLSDKDTVDLARHLEMFRVATSVLTNIKQQDAPITTDIFAFRGRGGFEQLGIDSGSVGRFFPGMRRNLIIIRDARGMNETAIIMHEYVHFLARNHGSFNYPKWFDEGLAEYLSASRQDRSGLFEIGRLPEHRESSLIYSRWIPMREIVSPVGYSEWSRERKSMFYAEAWALVHYLQNRPDRSTSFGQDMAAYIAAVESGQEVVEAFEASFGITVQDLDTEVDRYLRDGKLAGFRLKIDRFLADFDPEVVELSREHISLLLAQVALRVGALDMAEHLYNVAAADEDMYASAQAGMGDVRKFREEFEDALPFFERAVDSAPDDPLIQLDMAEYWHDRAEYSDDLELKADYLTRARKYYVQSWKLDNSKPETYAMFGSTYLEEGEHFDKAVEMLEQAEYLLPSSISIRIMLAEAYQGVGRQAEAEQRARSVLAWSHGESDAARRAREILSEQASGPD